MIYINYIAIALLLYSIVMIYKKRVPKDKNGNPFFFFFTEENKNNTYTSTPWSEMKNTLYLFFISLGVTILSTILVGFL